MTAVMIQLKKSYEDLNMTPEEIAEDQGLDLVAVKAALSNCSSKYRQDINKKPELDFSDNQLHQVNDMIFDLAMTSEDEHLRLKACMYLRDDKKGRREPTKVLQGNTFNVLTFNEQLQNARQKAEEAKSKLIDI